MSELNELYCRTELNWTACVTLSNISTSRDLQQRAGSDIFTTIHNGRELLNFWTKSYFVMGTNIFLKWKNWDYKTHSIMSNTLVILDHTYNEVRDANVQYAQL